MTRALPPWVPVLSCAEAGALEERRFAGNESAEWTAMQAAGRGVAQEILLDAEEAAVPMASARLLVLAGKGHNAGDALIALAALLERHPGARAEVVFVFGSRALRPLAARAWRELIHLHGARVEEGSPDTLSTEQLYDLCIDGVFGFQFRPPLAAEVAALFANVNRLPIRLRAGVDLPSANAFRADFTYATGSVKAPVLEQPNAGRVRFIDLGFFSGPQPAETVAERVLTTAVLGPIAGLRCAGTDKRTYGHVFLLGGSHAYPGAILMAASAAVRSGAGLVTAFVPETLASLYAAQVPEVMWVGWPVTPSGGLALEGIHLWKERLARASAMVIGPGLGRDRETLALVAEIVKTSPVPLVLDADALQRDIVELTGAPRILTPHAGEFERIAAGRSLAEWTQRPDVTTVLKGPHTRIRGQGSTYVSLFGGPVLARGGSGDLLAGLIGSQLAQTPSDLLGAACRGVVWHGCAADLLARRRGPTAVRITELLDYLSPALRSIGG